MEKLQKIKTRKLIKNSHLKENKRNNSNSVGCNNSSLTNISRNNNKLGI